MKSKPKHWPNLKSILPGFDALLQVLLISLAHENNVTSPLDLCPSIGRPIWIFFIILLVIGSFNGLGLRLEGAIGLGRVTLVWDTHFTFGGWVVGYSMDRYSCFLFTCQVAFGIVLPCVRIWVALCSLLCDICLLNACTMALARLFLMLFWFTCMLGYDLGNFVLWAYSQMSLPWIVSFDNPFFSICILFHWFIAHYKPLAWKTMIITTLGKFGALELFWEWVLN